MEFLAPGAMPLARLHLVCLPRSVTPASLPHRRLGTMHRLELAVANMRKHRPGCGEKAVMRSPGSGMRSMGHAIRRQGHSRP